MLLTHGQRLGEVMTRCGSGPVLIGVIFYDDLDDAPPQRPARAMTSVGTSWLHPLGIIFSWDVQALCISKTCGPCSLLFAPRPLRPRLTPSTHNTIISHAKHRKQTSRWPQSRASLIPRTWYGSTKCCACSYKHANLLTVGVPPPRSHWSQGLRPISGRLVDLWRYSKGQCCQGLYGGCMGGCHAHRQ